MSDLTLTRMSIEHLKFGHDPAAGESVNARVTDRDGDVSDLVASIMEFGVISPLVVVERDKGFFVIAGNRRLKALQQIVAQEGADKIASVPVHIIQAEDGRALEASLAAQIMHRPLHPVDEYECFASINKSPEEIAREFGRSLLEVKRALALGSLSPKVRKAWRDGKISGQAAQGFTLAPEFKTQDRVLTELQKEYGDQPVDNDFSVRRALKLEGSNASPFVNFLGVEAFEQAGGKLIRDLFEDRHVVLNPDLARQLAEDKLATLHAPLLADGWSWVASAHTLPSGWKFSGEYRELPVKFEPTKAEQKELDGFDAIMENANSTDDARERAQRGYGLLEDAIWLRSFTPEDKARSGVVLEIDNNGSVERHYGRVKVGQGASATSAPAGRVGERAKPAAKPEGQISAALMQRLSETLTWAAGEAMREAKHETVLACSIAAVNSFLGDTIDLKARGLAAKKSATPKSPPKFETALQHAIKHSRAGLEAAWAHIVGAALDFQTHSAHHPPLKDGDVAMVCELVPQEALQARLLHHFDAADYFKSVAMPIIKAAIHEMRPQHDLKGVEGKDAFVRIAVREQKATSWLPAELRTSGYQGPAGGAAKPAAKPKGAAKKAARKK